jgi:hypothetical protein
VIIEHRTFRLAVGTADATFLAADRRVQQEVAPFEPGFVRRTTARGDDGRWLVETLWFDDASATAAEATDAPAVAALRGCIDPATLRIERWTMLD